MKKALVKHRPEGWETDFAMAKQRQKYRCARCDRIGRRPGESDKSLIRRISMSYVWCRQLYKEVCNDVHGCITVPALGRFRLCVVQKDGRPWNTDPKNLEAVCPSCKGKHYQGDAHKHRLYMAELELLGQLTILPIRPPPPPLSDRTQNKSVGSQNIAHA